MNRFDILRLEKDQTVTRVLTSLTWKQANREHSRLMKRSLFLHQIVETGTNETPFRENLIEL